MDPELCNDKDQNLLNYIIENFCLDQLPYKRTPGIKISLCVSIDRQLVFSLNLDEDFQRQDKSSMQAFGHSENDAEFNSDVPDSSENNTKDRDSTIPVFEIDQEPPIKWEFHQNLSQPAESHEMISPIEKLPASTMFDAEINRKVATVRSPNSQYLGLNEPSASYPSFQTDPDSRSK